MITVAHLGDDPGLGGVNRSVESLTARLVSGFVHRRLFVTPTRGLPPAIDAQIIVIHFTMSWRKLVWLFGLRARNPNAQVVLVEHSYTRAFEARHVGNAKRFRTMLRMGYGMMDRVVAVSQAQGLWLAEAAALPADKLAVISPIAELDALRDLPLPLRRPGPLRLCGFGRYCPQKGFDTLISAMRLVPPEIATLRLVGLGPDEAALRAQADGLAHVTIEGPVAGPALLFGDVDAVVIPSRFEAYGLVAEEARAAGRPIIVSGVDGLTEQALPMPELTVPPETPAALAKAICWLADQDIAGFGALARGSVEGCEARRVDDWNRLLSELAGGGRLRAAA